MYQQHMVLKLRKHILKYTLNNGFPLLNISNCLSVITMANCLYLENRYITKFDFVNYAFANFVVVWFYLTL